MATATMPETSQSAAVVLYDGQCPLCQRSVRILRRLDWFHKLTCKDARQEENVPALNPPLDFTRLMAEMHVVTPKQRVFSGFGAFRWMAWRLPALWLVAPLLYLPGIPAIGQKIYFWVARNRFRLIPCDEGECRLPRAQTEKE